MKDSTYDKAQSSEQMAFNDICSYMRPFPAINFKGHTLDIAVKKAKSARRGAWDKEIDSAALKIAELQVNNQFYLEPYRSV